MRNTDDIYRCPYCRSDEVGYAPMPGVSKTFAVHCLECGAFGPTMNAPWRAIAAWNIVAEEYKHDENLLTLIRKCRTRQKWELGE